MSIFFSNILTNFFKNILTKSTYFVKIVIFSIINKSIQAFQARCINIFKTKKTTYNRKNFKFLVNTALTNFFSLMSLIFLFVGRIY